MITEYSVQPEENDQLQQITATPLLTCQCMSKLPTGVKYELRMVGLVAPNLGLRRIPDRLLCLVLPKASYLDTPQSAVSISNNWTINPDKRKA